MSFDYTIRNQSAPHFVTFQVVNWVDLFSRKRYRDILVENLNYCIQVKGLRVHGWVIMTNHIHCILSGDNKLSGLIRDFKSYTSKQLTKSILEEPESRRDWMLYQFKVQARTHTKNKYFQVWTHENHSIEVSDSVMMLQRLNYIHENPVRAGWVEEAHHYIYSSAIDYAGGKGLIKLDMVY